MSKITMPKTNNKIFLNKKIYIEELKKIVKKENILSHEDELKPYETDGLSAYKEIPMAVVLPENTDEVSKVLRYCNEKNIKVVPRGAGTGLSGGALPLKDSILFRRQSALAIYPQQNVRANSGTREQLGTRFQHYNKNTGRADI